MLLQKGVVVKNYVKEHFEKHPRADSEPRPAIVCADGTRYSVQASRGHYCTPREDNAPEYSSVEVFGPFTVEPEGWVSVRLVNQRIKRHGGLTYNAGHARIES